MSIMTFVLPLLLLVVPAMTAPLPIAEPLPVPSETVKPQYWNNPGGAPAW
ncbi:hypothetical protein I204_04091 [Kwoniella mangroviensis CBS 8886]|nr:uncharacterized protein I203_05650 [Kwoniella mangroviensis CBS 8507]OCF65400.1 hypothetical protein I203_05650 [Kwoniella mangroviensis CBS 8507]OCF75238.1 hypothetical protein I204_04091 [Kwoniella mangroviensis CBS 8886]